MQLNCERSWNKSVIHKINDFWYCVSQHETKYFFPKKWFHFSVRFLFLSLQNNTVVITQPCTRLRPLRMNPILTFFGNIWLQSNRQKGRIRKQTRSQLPKIWYVIKPSRTVKIKMIFQRVSRHSLILSKNIVSRNYATKYTARLYGIRDPLVTVFYDGKCGLCSREINHYKKIAPNGKYQHSITLHCAFSSNLFDGQICT